MYVIRLDDVGFAIIRGHGSLKEARLDFMSAAQNVIEPEVFPMWKRVVICESYRRDFRGDVHPIGIHSQLHCYVND